MSSFFAKPGKGLLAASLLAAVLFALPIKVDVQHPVGYSAALAGSRHDSADSYNNNTDNAGHEQNQDPQYNGQ